LRVGEVTRQDVGFGSGFAKMVGDAIEGATKEAATDALKRAARTFGNIFGLALYDKSRANVSAAPQPVISEAQRVELMDLFAASGVAPGPVLDRASKNAGREVKDLRELPLGEFEPLKKFLTSKTAKEPVNA
jgi:ribosomal protein S5